MKTEDDPLDPAPPREQAQTLAAIKSLEATVSGLVRSRGGHASATGPFMGRRRASLKLRWFASCGAGRMPLIGDGGGWWSFLHIDDAASATVAAIAVNVRGVFNVVDDEPAPVKVRLPALAEALGAKPPSKLPVWLVRMSWQAVHLATMMTRSRAGSNAKIKRELALVSGVCVLAAGLSCGRRHRWSTLTRSAAPGGDKAGGSRCRNPPHRRKPIAPLKARRR